MQKNILLKANSLLTLITGVSLTLGACGQNTASTSNVPAQVNGSLTPVETKEPNSEYKSAFAGQTRIAGVKTTTP